jgi:iron(III) transport system substrate-binding protein
MRSILAALAALVFSFAGPVAAREMTAYESALYEKAKSEGELTWYVSQFATNIAEDFAQAFKVQYPDIQVNVIRTSGQVIYSRLRQDMDAGMAQADVFSGSDIGHMVNLKSENKLLKFRPENADKIISRFVGIDPDGYYYTDNFESVALVYNTNLLSGEDAPKSWTDLLDPRWSGKIAVSHPGFSGVTGSWAVFMHKTFGDDVFERLAALDPLLSRSLADPLASVNNGERAIGLSTVAIASNSKRSGNPVEVIYPSDGVVVVPQASAVLADAPHPNAAQLFVNFMISEEGSRFLLEYYNFTPLRPELPAPDGIMPFEDMPVVTLSEDDVVNLMPVVIEDFRDAFGG